MKSMRHLATLVILLALGIGFATSARAAVDRGAIQGTVADAQGAVVPNVAADCVKTH